MYQCHVCVYDGNRACAHWHSHERADADLVRLQVCVCAGEHVCMLVLVVGIIERLVANVGRASRLVECTRYLQHITSTPMQILFWT